MAYYDFLSGKNISQADFQFLLLICKHRTFCSFGKFLSIANQMIKVAKTTYKYLVNLTLAENSPTNENLNIEILINNDFYWKFFN